MSLSRSCVDCLSLVLICVVATPVFGQRNKKEDKWLMVGNQALSAKLSASGRSRNYQGRLSVNLAALGGREGITHVEVRNVNIALFDVDQASLSGRKPKRNAKGVLGFATAPTKGKNPILKYDAATQTAEGVLDGFLGYPQMTELFPPKTNERKFPDEIYYPGQKAKLTLKISMKDKPRLDSDRRKRTSTAQISAKIEALKYKIYRPYIFELISNVPLQVGYILYFANTRTLDVQPVRVQASASDESPTGAGLEFGKPVAKHEWLKADVVFKFREWMTITDEDFKIVSEEPDGSGYDEEDALRDQVDEDDAVEVFFIERFDPPGAHGGGVTSGSGYAYAKVISSDANANNIDYTHLAHELGHVLGLVHPGKGCPNEDRPDVTDGSYGTLLCGSGFENDNPQKNSQWNSDHISNPLVYYDLALRKTSDPHVDCEHENCGSCD